MSVELVREWAQTLPEATVFTVDDARRALPEIAPARMSGLLRRAAGDQYPLVARLRRGYYCRRILGLHNTTRIPPEAWTNLAWLRAGPGAGWTAHSLFNQINWSTQVPMRTQLAVVAPAPRPLINGVTYVPRSNTTRERLTHWEVSLLEAALCFDRYSQYRWAEAIEMYREDVDRGWYRPASTVRTLTFMEVAAAERRTGPEFLERCEAIAAASLQAEAT